MHTRPNPELDATAAEIIGDSIWNLLERHGMPGLPLTQFTRPDTEDHIRVELSSGHTVWVAVLPEAPVRGAKYNPKHRRIR
jgi:hypothetical protein